MRGYAANSTTPIAGKKKNLGIARGKPYSSCNDEDNCARDSLFRFF
jgi:hypothetical protein